MVRSLQVPKNVRKFLRSYTIFGSSSTTHPHGVCYLHILHKTGAYQDIVSYFVDNFTLQENQSPVKFFKTYSVLQPIGKNYRICIFLTRIVPKMSLLSL
jgi:hypothetical protein